MIGASREYVTVYRWYMNPLLEHHNGSFIQRRQTGLIGLGSIVRSRTLLKTLGKATFGVLGRTGQMLKTLLQKKFKFGGEHLWSGRQRNPSKRVKLQQLAVNQTKTAKECTNTARPKSFAKNEYELRQKAQGSQPPSILDLVKTTHTKLDGTFVDQRVDALVKEVEEAAMHLQDSLGTFGSVSGPSQVDINHLDVQRARPRYGRLYGVGSAQTHYYHANVEYPSVTQQHQPREIEELRSEVRNVNAKFDRVIEELTRHLGTSTRTPHEDVAPTQDEHPTQMPPVQLNFDEDP